MSKRKKFDLVKNFRLTISDDNTHKELSTRKFTRVGALVTIITVVVVILALEYVVIAFTPIRTFIPGYPNAHTKHAAIQNAIRIDSLENEISKWELYSENLSRVVSGQTPLEIDSLIARRKAHNEADVNPAEIAKKDSLLRKEVTSEGKFDVNAGESRSLPIEGMHFFTPLKGVVSQGYDKALHPYIDITAPGNSVVMSVLDGTVISSGWSDDDGYTIRIQHEGDVISVYKHNQKVMKKTGDKVSAGTPIAIVGNSGKLSDGDHLHFELWHKGEAVDPTKYISF